MKILFVMIQPFDPYSGGVQMSTFKLSKKFTEMGMKTLVYSFMNTGHIKADYTTLHHSKGKNWHYNKENILDLYRLIKNEKPDIIINQMPYEKEINQVLLQSKNEIGCSLLACLRNTLFSVKLNIADYINGIVPTPANRLFHNSPGNWLFQKLHKTSHAKALKNILDIYDRFVMFGEPNNDEIKYFIGNYKQEKLAYIPNSIPHVLNELPIKEKRILWLSRLSYKQKQANLILPIWKKIYELLPEWELDVVGDGDAFQDIQQAIEKEKIPRITLYGKQKPDEYFKRSSLYIMTSSYEGFPNTAIEAQSFGAIPIIFDSYPLAHWVLNDTKDGFLIKPFDTDKMANTVVKLALNEEELKLIGKMALNNAKKFHIDKVGGMWQDLFKILT